MEKTKNKSKGLNLVPLAIICLSFISTVKAQNLDVIKLKYGPEIEGKLIEIKNDTVYFMAVGDVPMKYSLDRVEIIKRKYPTYSSPSDYNYPTSNTNPNKTGKILPDSGYFISVSANLSLRGLNPGVGFGYKFSSIIQPHVEVSYAKFYNVSGTFINAYAGIKGNFKEDWKSPFYILRGGYGFNITPDNWDFENILSKKGGAGIEFGLGTHHTVKSGKYTWYMALTENIQKAEFQYFRSIWDWRTGTSQNTRITEEITYYRLFLRLGIEI